MEAQRPYPYQFADWRSVGITTRMVQTFCKREKIGLRVLYKNNVILKNDVDSKGESSVLVYQIFSDHAFFYDDESVKKGAAQLATGPSEIQLKDDLAPRLQMTRDDDGTRVRYEDMERFRLEAFLEQVGEQISKVYWCYPKQIGEVQEQLKDAGINFYVCLGNRPEQVKAVYVQQKTRKAEKGKKTAKVQIGVRVVPDDHEILYEACRHFEEIAGLKMVYYGESRSVITDRMIKALFCSRRAFVQPWLRQQILEHQQHKCAKCGEKLGEHARAECDHIVPLCRGGTNEADNLRMLCVPCHAEETDELLRDGVAKNDPALRHTVESHLSPELHRQLHQGPKPAEVSWGAFDSTEAIRKLIRSKLETDEKKEARKKRYNLWLGKKMKARKAGRGKCIKDALHRHRKTRVVSIVEEPPLPKKCAQLKCLDAVGCRSNALLKCSRGLPVFSPLDDWEPFSLETLPEVDFVFVEVEGPLHSGLFPYTGARWYAAEVVEYMLKQGTVFEESCKASLRATRHVESEILQKQLDVIAKVYQHVHFYQSEDGRKTAQQVREDYIKGCFLSAIGLWNCAHSFEYKQVSSFYEIDAGAGVKQRKRLEDGSFLFTTFREKVGLFSMAPWGRIALDVEQMRIAQALETAEKFSDHVSVAGVHVDGIFLLQHTDQDIDEQLVSQHLWPDGTPQFKLKKEPTTKVPTWPRKDQERSQQIAFQRPEWTILEEVDFESWEELLPLVANLVVAENLGLLLAGPCGVGKSTFLRQLMTLLAQLQKGRHFATALRHCTCKLICGKTIAHYLQKYRGKGGAPAPGTIVVIDEWSEVQLHTWAELAQWKLVGVIFILVGDADGQRKPTFDKWQDSMNRHDIRKSSLIHELCGGLRLNLSKNRRTSEKKLFDDMMALYPFADDERRKPITLAHLRGEYPLSAWDAPVGTYMVVTHQKRMLLNQMVNWKLAAEQPNVEFLPCYGELPGASNQPQDMLVWPGLELLCYSRRSLKNHPVSGVVYVVEKCAGGYLWIRQHDDYDGQPLIRAEGVEPAEAVESDEEAEVDVDDGAESDPDVVEDLPENRRADPACVKKVVEVRRADGSMVKKDTFKMTYRRANELLRLQHACVYAQMQGRTFRSSVALLDLDKPYVTMRDVITAMGRPTTGEHLHFVTKEQESKLCDFAERGRTTGRFDLQKRAAALREQRASAQP